MTNLKCVVLRHHRKNDGTYNVKVRVTHLRKVRYLPTNYYATDAQLTRGYKLKDPILLASCDKLLANIHTSLAKLSPFASSEMSVDDIVCFIRMDQRSIKRRIEFFAFADTIVAKKSAGTAMNYRNALLSLQRFIGERELDIQRITRGFLEEYIKSRIGDNMEARGVAATVHYISLLHTIYKAAMLRYNTEEEVPLPHDPFLKVEIPKIRHKGQRALPTSVIQMMIDDTSCPSHQRRAIDIFLLSFALMGINLVDIFNAAKPKHGVLVYERTKVANRRTDRALMKVRVPDCIKPIVKRCEAKGGSTWFGWDEQYGNVRNVTARTNYGLAQWAARHKLEPFTFYAARHTWATVARSKACNIDKALVDECLAHKGDYALLDIYAERDYTLQWDANEKVLSLLDWSRLR